MKWVDSIGRWWRVKLAQRRTDRHLRSARNEERAQARQEQREQAQRDKLARAELKRVKAEEKAAQNETKRLEDLENKRRGMRAQVWVLGRPRPHRGTIPLQEALDTFPRTARKSYATQSKDYSAFAPIGAGLLAALASIYLLFSGAHPLLVVLTVLGGIGGVGYARRWSRLATEVGTRPVYLVWRDRVKEAEAKPLETISGEKEKARKAILAGEKTEIKETSPFDIWKDILVPVPTSSDRIEEFDRFNKFVNEVMDETAEGMGIDKADVPRMKGGGEGLPPPGLLKQIGEFEDLASTLASTQAQAQIKRLIVLLLPVLLAIVLVVEVLFLSD